MEFLYILVFIGLAVQVAILIFNKKNKKVNEVSVPPIFKKYNIKSRGDLFKMINSQSIPEEDRLLLEEQYRKQN